MYMYINYNVTEMTRLIVPYSIEAIFYSSFGRKLPEWNGATLLSIADSTESIEFMATAACQARLTQIWNGYFHFSRTTRLAVSRLEFPYILRHTICLS